MNDAILASAAGPPFGARHHRYLAVARRRQRRRHVRSIIALAATIGTCMGIGGWLVHSICPQGPRDVARGETRTLAEAAMATRARTGRMPRTMADVVGEVGAPRLSIGLVDPWGHPYVIVSPPLRGAWGVNVVSAGRDGVFFTDDDIGNWDE